MMMSNRRLTIQLRGTLLHLFLSFFFFNSNRWSSLSTIRQHSRHINKHNKFGLGSRTVLRRWTTEVQMVGERNIYNNERPPRRFEYGNHHWRVLASSQDRLWRWRESARVGIKRPEAFIAYFIKWNESKIKIKILKEQRKDFLASPPTSLHANIFIHINIKL